MRAKREARPVANVSSGPSRDDHAEGNYVDVVDHELDRDRVEAEGLTSTVLVEVPPSFVATIHIDPSLFLRDEHVFAQRIGAADRPPT